MEPEKDLELRYKDFLMKIQNTSFPSQYDILDAFREKVLLKKSSKKLLDKSFKNT